MENNIKSGLRRSVVIAIFSLLAITAISTQLVSSNKNVNKPEEIAEENIQENNTIIETQIVATSRSSIDRREDLENIENIEKAENKENYITIAEIKISKDMDLSKRCGISKQDFRELTKNLKKDTTKFFYNNSDIIYDLCEKYELNEIFFCGLIIEESGWKVLSNRDETCNYISMMSKGKLIKFSTQEEGLEAAAKLLHTKYLSENGKFYTGKTLTDVQKNFAPRSTKWIERVYKCMNQIV